MTPYSIARAELVAEQIGRFATQHVHQLAGHRANLAFWIDEASAAIRALDGYEDRFRRLRDAQGSWVRENGTRIGWCPICASACEVGLQAPRPAQRVPMRERAAARDAVRNAIRRFLLRLHHAGLVAETELRRCADLVGVVIEAEDLKPDAP